jgi:hypothetical protein
VRGVVGHGSPSIPHRISTASKGLRRRNFLSSLAALQTGYLNPESYDPRRRQLLECAPNVARCYRFDQFALDSGTRQLLRDGKEVHVSPKAFDLLCALVEVRRALGDSAEEPTFVQTLHRFGYRFIAAVHEDIPADEEPVTPHVRYWLVWETRQIPLR